MLALAAVLGLVAAAAAAPLDSGAMPLDALEAAKTPLNFPEWCIKYNDSDFQPPHGLYRPETVWNNITTWEGLRSFITSERGVLVLFHEKGCNYSAAMMDAMMKLNEGQNDTSQRCMGMVQVSEKEDADHVDIRNKMHIAKTPVVRWFFITKSFYTSDTPSGDMRDGINRFFEDYTGPPETLGAWFKDMIDYHYKLPGKYPRFKVGCKEQEKLRTTTQQFSTELALKLTGPIVL